MPTLRNFSRLHKKETISFQLICQASLRLSGEVWRNINGFFADRMVAEGKTDPDEVRGDGTVVETNIHRPTDSSLCYDGCRTVGRIVNNARKAGFEACFEEPSLSCAENKESGFPHQPKRRRGPAVQA